MFWKIPRKTSVMDGVDVLYNLFKIALNLLKTNFSTDVFHFREIFHF